MCIQSFYRKKNLVCWLVLCLISISNFFSHFYCCYCCWWCHCFLLLMPSFLHRFLFSASFYCRYIFSVSFLFRFVIPLNFHYVIRWMCTSLMLSFPSLFLSPSRFYQPLMCAHNYILYVQKGASFSCIFLWKSSSFAIVLGKWLHLQHPHNYSYNLSAVLMEFFWVSDIGTQKFHQNSWINREEESD